MKKNTRHNLQSARGRLLKFFGLGRPLQSITAGDAHAWVVSLRRQYAQATIGGSIKQAKQFFKAAVRNELIARNPFADLKAPAQTNKGRKFFVSREAAQAVLDGCPDTEWRLLIALSRFGGLRCPSEHLALTWADVDWERSRLRVPSCKTERHDGHGERGVPIFPELRPYLEEAFDLAEPGAVYVITRYRKATKNFRTRLQRIIRRAGLTPWPRLFHNLRATRQTELAAEYPLHVVCSWIGNAQLIAAKHYLQVTDADFQRASQGNVKSDAFPTQKAAQQAAAPLRTVSQEKTEVPSRPVKHIL